MSNDNRRGAPPTAKKSADKVSEADHQRLAELDELIARPTDVELLEAKRDSLEREQAVLEEKKAAVQEVMEQLRGRGKGEELESVLQKAEANAGPHKPTLANELTFALFIPPLMSVHDGFPTGDLPSPAWTPAGQALRKAKLTGTRMRKVLHRKKGIVMQGHDVGPILHVVGTPEPVAAVALSALRTATASRKCMFGAPAIMLEKGGPIGSCMLTNWPPTPMLFCGDPVPIPFGCSPFSRMNTVSFNMSGMDYLLGFTLIAVDIAVSAAFSAMVAAAGGDPGQQTSAEKAKAAMKDAAVGMLVDMSKSTVTSVGETAAVAVLGEPRMESDVVWLDLHVWSYSTTYEKTRDEVLPMQKVGKRSGKDADDPEARYSLNLNTWGEVL